MTYATQSDLTDRFGAVELAQLTDRTSGLVIDTVVLARALADADAEIDSYLATRYALPLASTPVVLVRLAADMARYRLYDDRVTESVRVRYQDAVSLLKRLASGEVRLDGATTPPAAASDSSGIAVRAPDRVFSADVLANY
jgi:phage gp36-like protein